MIKNAAVSITDVYADTIISCDGNASFRKSLKKRYPKLFKLYSKNTRNNLGTIIVYPQVDQPDVISVFIKERGTINLAVLVKSLKTIMEMYGNINIAIPYKLGMNISDNEWNDITMVINKVFENYNGNVLICL